MKNEIKIKYDGKYPCLCMGHLLVIVNGIEYDFGNYSLSSGGSVSFDEEWNSEVTEGEWSVDFPENFPNDLKEEVLNRINEEIPHGCCGGCI